MAAESSSKLKAMINLKCPKCHKGDLFISKNPFNIKKLGKMPSSCSHCGQDFVIEPGFYFGATYVSYVITVAYFATGFLTNWLLFKQDLEWYAPVLVGGFVLLSPMIIRVARSVWIHTFVKFGNKV